MRSYSRLVPRALIAALMASRRGTFFNALMIRTIKLREVEYRIDEFSRGMTCTGHRTYGQLFEHGLGYKVIAVRQ